MSAVIRTLDYIFLLFGYLGSICMYVLFVTNPVVAAKSNKPLLLLYSWAVICMSLKDLNLVFTCSNL